MSKSLDRLTLLATFARIAERGSISAAARDVGLSQASASRQLAELEARLGTQLVQRTTHSLSLTEDGEQALIQARTLLEGWETLAESFAETASELKGNLKVVAPVALGQLHLAAAALAFQRDHPGVSITWLLEDGPVRFAEIGCDLWIKIGEPADDALVVQRIGTVERMVVAAPALLEGRRVASPQDLAALPCAALGPFEGAQIPLHTPAGEEAAVSASSVIASNNIFSVYQAARMAVGFAVMPRWFVDRDLESGALVDVLPGWRAPELAITAAYLPARRRTRRLIAFREHMVRAIQAVPGVAA